MILPREAAVAVQELCHPILIVMMKRNGIKESSCLTVATVVVVAVAVVDEDDTVPCSV